MKLTDEDLVLYADNRLNKERKKLLQDAAKSNTELAQTLAALDASRLPYQAAFDNQQIPLPDQLRTDMLNVISKAESDSVNSVDSRGSQRWFFPLQNWKTPMLQAACLLLSLGAGFLLGVNQDKSSTAPVSGESASDKNYVVENENQLRWVERVADYQTLYVANTVGQIEPDMPATIEKLERLSQAAGMKSAIPDLSSAGYKFARAQELGYNGETLVQLVYSKDGHSPLALCFMPADGDLDEHLKISERHGLGTASWIDNNQRFVIVADEPTDALRMLHVEASTAFIAG